MLITTKVRQFYDLGRTGFEPTRQLSHRFTVCCFRPLSHLPKKNK